MSSALFAQLERLRADGALVLLKWDPERVVDRCTVVVTRSDTDYAWRKDSDDIAGAVAEAVAAYWAAHAGGAG
ncbi:hypothetical protein [Inhella crocodyli]|uniref:Uncharacterized protein n=1 Tax=Inhella crocodyli TaxID=2499851 RepID=A0A3S2VEK3_9BURK|nr:hypothetical protein [Inhella crocodyli]RVT84998.1 hypothetical protein EOD73_12840 [Inhella crocodyli]